jgi:hypothetical protein
VRFGGSEVLLILRYQNNSRVDGILLAASHDRMRVVMPGCKDSTELRLKKRRWVSAEGCVAEIEAVALGRGAENQIQLSSPHNPDLPSNTPPNTPSNTIDSVPM